jgi:hypothetical protein
VRRAKGSFEFHSALVTPSIVRSLRSAPALSARSTGSAARVEVRQLNGARDCQIRVLPANGHDKPAGRHLSTSVHARTAGQT